MNYGVKNIINERGNSAANQFIIKTDKAVYFQSYNSVVCKLDGVNIVLSSYWDYSKTTLKHLYIFLRQHGYYTLCSTKEMRKAIKDGRVIELGVSSLKID